MNGATHTITGAIAGVSLCLIAGMTFKLNNATVYPIATIFLSTTGSLAPDVDIPRSTMGRKHPLLSRMFTHRGLTHTLLFPMMIGIACYFSSVTLDEVAASLLVNLLFPFMFGWVVHIFADMCNKKGVPLLWPLIRRRIHIATFKTGTWNEGAFVFLVASLVLVQSLWKLSLVPQFF